MLKLFRTIRKKLIEEKNVRSYLLYAVREILLDGEIKFRTGADWDFDWGRGEDDVSKLVFKGGYSGNRGYL